MAPRTRGVIAADIELIQTMVNSTIAHPIDGLPVRSIEGMVEWIDANFSKLEQMKADEEISEDGLPEITRMQTIMQRVKFDCLRNLGERPPIPPRIGPPIIQQGNPRTSRAKIERETIPRFDGNIRKFKKFWIPFKSLVWSNPELDSSEKLRRLYANVNESVHRLLPDIDNTVIDLDQIEDDLKKEFQNEVKLQLEFRTVLTSLSEFTNCYDSQGWRRVEEVARDIKSLFPKDVIFHHTALKEIAKKLPSEGATRLRLSTRFTIETLLEICKEFITAESRMDNLPVRETTTSNSEQRNRSRDDNRGQNYRANVASTQPASMCLICLGSHDTASCLISLDERRRMVIQRKGCFRCLRAYTRNHECSQIETCQRCNRAHNLLIGCGNRNERGSGSPSTRRPEYERPVPNQPDNSNNARLSERSTLSQSNDEQMTTESTTNANLTQADGDRYTPVIQVIVDFNGRKQQVRAILDCGADVSHISLPCAQRLRAPIIDNGITQMSAFANPTTEERDLVTEIRIRSMINDNSVLIPLHVVPKITYGHYSSPTDEILKWMSERGFETTDEDDIKPPDVLIGNDVLEEHFWTGRREQIAPFLWARETHFGWCVVGSDKAFSSKQTRQKTIARKCNLISRKNGTRMNKRFLEVSDLFRTNVYMDDIIQTPEMDSTESRWIEKRVPEMHVALRKTSCEIHKIYSSNDEDTDASGIGLQCPTGRFILKVPGSNFSPTVRKAESDLASSFIQARGRLAPKMSTETISLFELKSADMACETTSSIKKKHPTIKKIAKTYGPIYENLLNEKVEATFGHLNQVFHIIIIIIICGLMFRNSTKMCTHCNRMNFDTPSAPLPMFRIQPSHRAFNVFGPILKNHKYYDLFFTYAITRGLHLELLENMSAYAILNTDKRYLISATWRKSLTPTELTTSITRLRSHHHDVTYRQPKVGQLDVITEKDKTRENWPIAKKELIAEPDGVSRVAVVNPLEQRTLTRPVKLLVRLEIPRLDEYPTTALSAAGEDVTDSNIRHL